MSNGLLPIEAYLPHQGTMRLLDRLVACDADSIVAEVRVPFDGLFLDPDGMPAWVGIEYMAQTVAAWAGVQARARGEAPRVGFLLGTRRYECTRGHFARGRVLRIEARCEIMGDNGLGAFACRILDDGEEVAAAHLSVFEPADADVFLQGSSE